MLILGINTSGDACEAALVRDGVVLAQLSEPMMQGHDARLAPVVETLMREAGLAFDVLDRVTVVVGPGSFTGIRVGVAFARGLALSLDIPAVGVSSLEALDPAANGRMLGLLPAKRRPPERTWWAQTLEGGRGTTEPIETGAADVAQLASGVDGVAGQLDGIPDVGLPRHEAKPRAAAAALLAGAMTGDLPLARPIYVREPDATPMRPIGQ